MTRLRANALLLLAALCWGAGNVAQKTVLEDLGPLLAFGLRSLIGLIVIFPMLWREAAAQKSLTNKQWGDLACVSVFFCAALAFQQISFAGTSVTNASFLVNTTVVFTPILAWLIIRERPGLILLPSISLVVCGLLLMAGGLGGMQWGDVTCIVSAILYSAWIVLIAQLTRELNRPFTLAACQFGLAALVGTVFGLACEKVSVHALKEAAPELAMLGVLSTGVAFTLQTIAQRFTPPTHAAIVMSAESVFGAAAAWALLSEQLSLIGGMGAALILSAVLLIQLAMPLRFDVRKPEIALRFAPRMKSN